MSSSDTNRYVAAEWSLPQRMFWPPALLMVMAILRISLRFFRLGSVFSSIGLQKEERLQQVEVCRDDLARIASIALMIRRLGAYRMTFSSCLVQSLTLMVYLRSCQMSGCLCIGAYIEGEEFGSHAWVEVNDRIVLGGNTVRAFKEMSRFGWSRP